MENQEQPKFKKLTNTHYTIILLTTVLLIAGLVVALVSQVSKNHGQYMQGYNSGQYESQKQVVFSADVIRERINEISAELYLISPPIEDYSDEIGEERYLEDDQLEEITKADGQYNPYAQEYAYVPDGWTRNDKGYLISPKLF